MSNAALWQLQQQIGNPDYVGLSTRLKKTYIIFCPYF